MFFTFFKLYKCDQTAQHITLYYKVFLDDYDSWNLSSNMMLHLFELKFLKFSLRKVHFISRKLPTSLLCISPVPFTYLMFHGFESSTWDYAFCKCLLMFLALLGHIWAVFVTHINILQIRCWFYTHWRPLRY